MSEPPTFPSVPAPPAISHVLAPRAALKDEASAPANEAALRVQARRFEAAFLAEMLRHTGVARMPESFNGGAGEQAFAGSLIQAYADRIVERGGLGLADQIYTALKARSRP